VVLSVLSDSAAERIIQQYDFLRREMWTTSLAAVRLDEATSKSIGDGHAVWAKEIKMDIVE
jgi:hypothetical protein